MVALRLAAIQAQMKLKKIRDAKAKQNKGSEAESEASARPAAAAGSIRVRPRSQQSSVQVPTSPVRGRRSAEQEQKSPARVVLGIDKGLKATEVSLKRAASAGGSISRAHSFRRDRQVSTPNGPDEVPRPKTFSERLAVSRLNEKEIQEKENRIKKARSTGFGIAKSQTQESTRSSSSSGRLSPTKRSSTPLDRSRSVLSKDAPRPSSRPSSSASKPDSHLRSASLSAKHPSSRAPIPSSDDHEGTDIEDAHTLEPYSGIHLSKRLIDHDTLTRTFRDKELYTLPRLLKEVVSPSYDPPSCESDYVVLGIVAYKSTAREQKPSNRSISTSGEAEDKARPKFMHLRLTDLKWEIDLFLFDSGFERWWKLIPGTVIAVLNPGIMPPRNKDKGDFSLKVSSSEDTILEIGRARDMRFCDAKRADGTECPAWVDGRKTGVCDYHMNLQIEKARRGRMEVNGMAGLAGGGSGKGSWREVSGKKKDDGLVREGKYHDKFLHETMWIAPKEFARPTSALIDGDEDYNAFERGMSREELRKRRVKEEVKERELAKKLSLKGVGTGSEYLKARVDRASAMASHSSTAQSSDFPEAPDAKALGLLNNKANDVHLSPVKGRKKAGMFTQEPMGWSGAFKRGLPSPTRGLSPTRESSMRKRDSQRSPSPKKARFMVEGKGIREPGRESLPGNVVVGGDVFLDDDDDLDIIK